MRIGILSDTHSHLDTRIFKHFEACDQVWHAGDIGDITVSDTLKASFVFKAVYGNIDGTSIRAEFPEDLIFEIEQKTILMTHIAGKPGSYSKRVVDLIRQYQPDVLVCGHSHILRVEFDKKYNLLYINPGAAGVHGFHKVRTLLRFEISAGQIKHMEVVELGPRVNKIT